MRHYYQRAWTTLVRRSGKMGRLGRLACVRLWSPHKRTRVANRAARAALVGITLAGARQAFL